MKYAIRSIFVPGKDNLFLAFDLSQAESWVSAYLARDDNFKYNLKFKDVHTATAAGIFDREEKEIKKDSNERYLGKKANHGLTYMMTADKWTEVVNGESEDTGITVSLAQMRVLRDKWLALYPGIPRWWKEVEEAIRTTRLLTTPYGRKRMFFGLYGDDMLKSAISYCPQSTVADHTLGAIQHGYNTSGGLLGVRAMLREEFNSRARIVHTAHDSIMLEVPKAMVQDVAPRVYQLMHRPILIHGDDCLIPVDGEVGERWGELEKMKIAA